MLLISDTRHGVVFFSAASDPLADCLCIPCRPAPTSFCTTAVTASQRRLPVPSLPHLPPRPLLRSHPPPLLPLPLPSPSF